MKKHIAALVAALSALCCGARAETVNGSEFFHLVPGTVWTLYDELYPERVTTITVEGDKRQRRGGATTLYFRKNHPEAYHGFANNNLIWFVQSRDGWIQAGNSNGTDVVGDAYPDDIRVSRDTGLEVVRVWLRAETPGLPAAFLIPSGDFTVPSQVVGSNKFFARYPSGYEGWSPVATWTVTWELVEPDVLVTHFDEEYADTPSSNIYEDWYLRKGHGLIGIRQYYDKARTQKRRGTWE